MLNLKNPEVLELVEQLVRLTGETKTQAICTSVRERLARETARRAADDLTAELLRIGERSAACGQAQSADHNTLLYDDKGLPR